MYGYTNERVELQVNQALLDSVRRLHVFWIPCEAGAPYLYAGELPDSMAEFEDVPTETQLETLKAAEILLKAGSLQTKSYRLNNFWKRYYADGCPIGADTICNIEIPSEDFIDFEVSMDHLKLLSALNFREGQVNPKRPYGDMTFYYLDIASVLGRPILRGTDGQLQFSEGDYNEMDKMHGEMLFVTQAFLCYGDLAEGRYRQDADTNWVADC